MPQQGLAIVPCGPGTGCCDTPGRLIKDMTGGASLRHGVEHSLNFRSFTRDVQATICLELLVVSRFPHASRATNMMYAPSRFGYSSVSYSFPTVYIYVGR